MSPLKPQGSKPAPQVPVKRQELSTIIPHSPAETSVSSATGPDVPVVAGVYPTPDTSTGDVTSLLRDSTDDGHSQSPDLSASDVSSRPISVILDNVEGSHLRARPATSVPLSVSPSRPLEAVDEMVARKDSSEPLPQPDSKLGSPEIAASNSASEKGTANSQKCPIPILYNIRCIDMVKNSKHPQIDRYSDKQFEGLEAAENRQTLCVMDVSEVLYGHFPPGKVAIRGNQRRDQFGSSDFEDDERPFVVGRDFIVRAHHRKSVRIMSTYVIEFLRKSLKYYPAEISRTEYTIQEPYRPLVFSYEAMKAAIECPEDHLPLETQSKDLETSMLESTETLSSHLGTVAHWLEPFYRKEIEPELSVHKLGRATYEKLWLLFPPGTIVYTAEDENPSFYVVQSIDQTSKESSKEHFWTLRVWNLKIKQNRVRRRLRVPAIQISKFWGEKDIASLPLIPLDRMENEEKKRDMISRGKQFLEHVRRAPLLLQYDGALSQNKLLRYSGAVVVDPDRTQHSTSIGSTVQQTSKLKKTDLESKEPSDGGGGPLFSQYNEALLTHVSFVDEDMYLLLPGRIWGFALGKKQWASFDVPSFVERDKKPNLFRYLVIEEKHLSLIKALASPDSGTTEAGVGYNDFVEGKGFGKVVLLHGPPGVGKTFTVECLAQEMRRPLLALTAADIGTDQSLLEQKLSAWLDLAQRWNAIVLLDEADTYLEKRAQKELTRNAFVTAFLRVLEYYPGTIFLTTNQPAWIDDAFISRIHACIPYKNMDDATLSKVWLRFLRWAESESAKPSGLSITVGSTVQNYVTRDPEVQKMCRSGRDIRNAVQAAVKIAAYRLRQTEQHDRSPLTMPETIELEIEDFREAIQNKKAYQLYRDSIETKNQDERALTARARGTHHPDPDPDTPTAKQS